MRVAGRRHEVLSHWFLTAVMGALPHQKEQQEHLFLLASPLLAVVSQYRGYMMLDDRWCDSQVGREALQGTIAHLIHLSTPDESLGPKGAWTWGQILVHTGASKNGRCENVGASPSILV